MPVSGNKLGDNDCLIRLIADGAAPDLMLDDETLFLSGVFPERRGFPGLSYYVALGSAHFRAAGEHRLAQRYQLTDIFGMLPERFETTRQALNDISERLFAMGDPDDLALEKLINAPSE